ncbi:gamma-tubulin complex component 2 isoform X2 [Phalaenopsis equestris]|uniref:gamma-tubulin complex component 2 isoform X2 n=1 Tax=Phalaenopsis equestris TaxID=78828 RepID=UPI0009E36B82|nr:gamma-tubulin complex component 2 isoform X2 [Phalaenopsis equestris]
MDPNLATPKWNLERPFLTGRFHQDTKLPNATSGTKPYSLESLSRGCENVIGSYPVSVQELLVIDDLLSALVGIEGRYISIRRARGKEGHVVFQIDPSMDLALQELIQRFFPLCEAYALINWFVETKSHFGSGLVNHALAAAMRALLLDYQAMVAQLEHQFRLGRLSVQANVGSATCFIRHHRKGIFRQFVWFGYSQPLAKPGQAKAMAGDTTVRALLEKMTQSASSPYLSILERWVYEGVIDDPYDEFFIAENKSLKKESLTLDYDAKYWQQRYSLKDSIPSFLRSAAGMILTTGKYLNVMRECGHNVQVPPSENSKLTSFESDHHYLKCVKIAYDFASCELLNLIKEKYGLIGKLRSMKRYFLLDQGDFLVHFMDIAMEELVKRPEDTSVEKLQTLLDLALRSTAAAADPCHEELTCCVERVSLLRKLSTLKDLESPIHAGASKPAFDIGDPLEPISITGIETFSLSYKVQWPLSLVISRKALTKYQLIFQFLFHCKHVERQLCVAWQVHQGFRCCNIIGTSILRSSSLCRSMLKFINSLLHYLTFEVLEPNWHLMHDRLQTVKSIDEVIQLHDSFLQKCLKECLLLLPLLVKKVEKLKSICLQYAASIQLLVPSIYTSDVVDSVEFYSFGLGKSKERKTRGRSLAPKAAENPIFLDSIMKFENDFNVELQSLRPILSSGSQTEPYLTHLAQCILGVGGDQ